MTKPDWTVVCAQNQTQKELLKVIDFWWPKAKAYRDGHKWLVKSISELINDHGMSSDRSIKRAVKDLKEAKLLFVERHWHPYRPDAKVVYWLRPNLEQIGLLVAPQWPVSGLLVARSYIQITDNSKTDLQSGAERSMKKSKSGSDFLTKKKSSATISSALDHLEKKDPSFYPDVKTPQVAHYCLVSANVAAGYPTPGLFNPQRGGQLKVFLSRIRDQGIEATEVGEFMFFLAKKWPEFLGWMEMTFNAKVAGTAPNHNALVKYAPELVAFYQGYEVKPSVKESVSGGNLSGDFG